MEFSFGAYNTLRYTNQPVARAFLQLEVFLIDAFATMGAKLAKVRVVASYTRAKHEWVYGNLNTSTFPDHVWSQWRGNCLVLMLEQALGLVMSDRTYRQVAQRLDVVDAQRFETALEVVRKLKLGYSEAASTALAPSTPFLHCG